MDTESPPPARGRRPRTRDLELNDEEEVRVLPAGTWEPSADIETGDQGYKYMDHTADVIVHSWGPSINSAFNQAVLGVYNYMTDLKEVQEKEFRDFSVVGSTVENLFFSFLDEAFSFYGEDYFLVKKIQCEVNTETLVARARVWGECFDRKIHSQGTEVKAITKHGLTITQNEAMSEVLVLLDI